MQRSTKAVLLILGGVIAIAAVLWWLFGSFIKQRVLQPPPLPSGTTQRPTGGTPPAQQPAPTPDASSPAERERRAQEALKQQASDFSARAGSYSSVDGFASIRDVYVGVTASVQTYLEVQRKQLIQAHPAYGPSWGQTTRSLASRITSPLPVLGKDTAEVTVQVQVTVEAAGASPQVSYQEIILSYQKIGGAWIVSHISSQPFTP